MTDQTLAQDAVTDTEQTSQAATKTYTQEEVDNMMAGLKASVTRRAVKPYEELGDVETLRKIKTEYDAQQQKAAIERGEFESTLNDIVARKDAEIAKREQVIRTYKLETPLLDAAARHKAVSPAQVQKLLRESVDLNEDGEPVVLRDGKPARGDDGKPLSIDQLVSTFLAENPHFVAAAPSTKHSSSRVNTDEDVFDVSKLDMKNPAHRKRYQEAKAAGLI